MLDPYNQDSIELASAPLQSDSMTTSILKKEPFW